MTQEEFDALPHDTLISERIRPVICRTLEEWIEEYKHQFRFTTDQARHSIWLQIEREELDITPPIGPE